MQPTFCTTRQELLSEYAKNAREYSDLVRHLSDRIRTTTNREFLDFQDQAEAARKRTENARLEYEEHLRVHGCSLPEIRSTSF